MCECGNEYVHNLTQGGGSQAISHATVSQKGGVKVS